MFQGFAWHSLLTRSPQSGQFVFDVSNYVRALSPEIVKIFWTDLGIHIKIYEELNIDCNYGIN